MNRISTKVYLYDSSQEANEYRGTDYSKYVLIGDSDTDNLDDTLDTAELTLAGLSFREEFEPTTKFIVEKWENSQTEDSEDRLISTFHWVVSNDTVTQPILSRDDYFDHELSLIEPTVIAQHRLVDNISVTYELKDVSLESQATYSVTDKINLNKINLNGDNVNLENYNISNNLVYFGHKLEWVMPDWYTLSYGGVSHTPSWNDWIDFNLNQTIPTGGSKTIYLPVPMLKCYYSYTPQRDNSWIENGFCSIDVIIAKYDKTGQLVSTTGTTVNPSSTNTNENYWNKDNFGDPVNSSFLVNGDIISHFEFFNYKGEQDLVYQLGKKYFITKMRQLESNAENNSNRLISLTIQDGYRYKIIIKKHVYNNLSGSYSSALNTLQFNLETYMVGESKSEWNLPFFNALLKKGLMDIASSTNFISNDNFPKVQIEFNGVNEVLPTSIMFKSAPPANAYDLFVKAQLTTQNFKKKAGVPIKETITPFYLNDDDVQQLQNTTIIENFYNQKNLHEIFMDIGKYIHARPKAKFGADDRFLIDWKKYGQTQQYEDNSRPISVFNSKFVEEYISSVSSYVTNMVQLGGTITEILAAKSSSEDYLVYNDVAEIITSKNIIQIDNLNVIRKSDKEIRNLTGNGIHGESENGYVFEENVYKLLSLDPNDSINKGLAIYYELGTNTIKGLNFQLPSVNTGDGDTDYAIKRIIGTVYNIAKTNWKDIKVNDYLFEITYKTKDTLRADQTRPDLRKYLQNSKYDNIPLHYQFNNQQDIVVDSAKFGHNMYGKLIRTGNTTYERVEYVVDLLQLKHSGELYNIYGNLYYVSKVTNTYYPNYIISQVEFSKDFNRLSEIIGIPSEPRFFEISEQSLIKREVVFNEYIEVVASSGGLPPGNQWFWEYKDGVAILTTNYIEENLKHYIIDWNYLNSLIFNQQTNGPTAYPKYAITYFKSDENSYNPSNSVGQAEHLVETCSPLSVYSVNNTLTLEWDMVDNFSAGDQVKITANPSGTETDKAYSTLKPYRYPDVYGRCDMVDFLIVPDIDTINVENNNFNPVAVSNLPENPLIINENTSKIFSSAHIIPATDLNIKPITSVNYPSELTPYFTNRNYGDLFRVSYITSTTPSSFWIWGNKNLHEANAQGTVSHLSDLSLIQSPSYKDCYFVNDKYNYYIYDNVGSESVPNYQWVPLFSFLDGGYNQHNQGVIILKDNREALSFNMNIHAVADSDRFVFSSYFWQPNKEDVYIGLLNKEVNKITNNIITNADFLVDKIPFLSTGFWQDKSYMNTSTSNYEDFGGDVCLRVDMRTTFEDYQQNNNLTDEQMNELLDNTKAIVIYSDRNINNDSNAGAKYFVLARNVSDLPNQNKIDYWFIRPLFRDSFKKQ